MAQDTARWKKLIPDRATLQYAGSTGWLTAGAGYTLGKRHRTALDLMYGYVPQRFGGPVQAITVKGLYDIWIIHMQGGWSVSPLQAGLFASYTLGSDFYLFWPKDQYTFMYYWWSSGLRVHPVWRPELCFKAQNGWFKGKTIAGYMEFNTNGLYIVSWISNKEYIHPGGIIKMGAGLTVTF